jgi:hypothetical protein
VAAAALNGLAAAHPKPAAVPYRWELEFKAGDLRLFLDPVTGDGFWYLTYMVTNRTGRDQVWAPSLILFTDAGEILSSGREVPSRVTEDVIDLLGNPLLEEQNQLIGPLLHGRENAREGLAIWPARRLDANELSLFVRGISGESTRVSNPVTGQQITLYKTLQRDYLIRGDAVSRGSSPIELVEERWIMR